MDTDDRVPAAGGVPLLSVQRVDKRYPNGTVALEDVQLAIQPGEFVSLLGPSGCGKSTLLKMFAGIETPTHGHLRWWGQPFATVGSPGRRMSMVFQEATLMPWASVADNVRLPLDLAHVPRREADERVADALAGVGLAKFGRVRPRELSGGMQMRASLARALVTGPDLLLLDEPFGALDEFTRNRLDADLRALWQRSGMTVVFVTHSIYEAVYLSSRVVVMQARPGRVIGDVRIDGPQQRGDDYRMSEPFVQHCRVLSERIEHAHRAAAHDEPMEVLR
ncbi:ABC transporter ATP-binding protein [Paraburkholderia caballeronis]|uniref:NitT/TauT family transport system ATP-binding protein n=1 Tax=Paraburkholderia caballeronis TaxID=416943 RepID=A0A1H7G4A9_9BURK|nr:ABC transporter ATP-binding protein [Paraburkholderia caballeronis]PXW24775.1 NitT/TauT family transport system ATP-binding protein [Paraburkholderia caballeronis]PXX00505.1 NitT/TauT family transport system ATP-binding protein [Paraburkholderia caballeronis]RAJ98568.1 NitT/TauT family transport system ATP-binding protein [Paraburkholderia caballeronis]TDV16610.1 NitT/TauT family transport system ATP-binding protein [Paraburkholderia caballeronis]TDV19006.1 NitT/TauT family transport system